MQRDILILRDPRESAKKCSLTPLRGLPVVEFVSFRAGLELEAGGRLLLDPEAPELGAEDAGRGLFVIDCSWRRLPKLAEAVRGEVVRRRLPPLVTAYPRVSRVFDDPEQGLASIEALYAATCILGRPDPELLDGYRWAERFLSENPQLAV